MGKPKAPKPADPKVTAGAQTANNVGTAIANANLQNVNQVTPYGNLTYSQSGTHSFTDPNSGNEYDIPQYTLTQTLSDAQQGLLDENNRAQTALATMSADSAENMQDYLSNNPINVDGAPVRPDSANWSDLNLTGVNGTPDLNSVGAAPTLNGSLDPRGAVTSSYGGDYETSRKDVEDALFSRLNPQFDRDRGNLEARLASQGIEMGSAAYKDAMDELGRGQTDARYQAVLAGGQEHSRLNNLDANRAAFENAAQAQTVNQNIAATAFENNTAATQSGLDANQTAFNNSVGQQGFQNDINAANINNQVQTTQLQADQAAFNADMTNRSQYFQEQFAVRGQPINEITALMSGSQVSNPNFANPQIGSIPTTNSAQIQQSYDAQRASNWRAETQNANQWISGAMGLGGALISDRRTKTNIKKLDDKTIKGKRVGLYEYNYEDDKKGDPKHVGMMAQEVESVFPEAVITADSGVKAIDYSVLQEN